MTNNERLLMPRYLAIADYPGNIFSKGDVISSPDTNRDGKPVYYLYDDKGKSGLFPAFFDEYPRLLRKLQWWEHRKPEEMPEYVKFTATTWKYQKNEIVPVFNWYEYPMACIYHQSISPEILTPATLEEFEAFKKIKNV